MSLLRTSRESLLQIWKLSRVLERSAEYYTTNVWCLAIWLLVRSNGLDVRIFKLALVCPFADLATSPIPQDSWLLMETNTRKKRTNSCSSSSSTSSLKSISRRRLEMVPVLAKRPSENTIAIQTGNLLLWELKPVTFLLLLPLNAFLICPEMQLWLPGRELFRPLVHCHPDWYFRSFGS